MPAIRDLKGKPVDGASEVAFVSQPLVRTLPPSPGPTPPSTPIVVVVEAPPNTEAVLRDIAADLDAMSGLLAHLAALSNSLRRAVNADLDKSAMIAKLADAVATLSASAQV